MQENPIFWKDDFIGFKDNVNDVFYDQYIYHRWATCTELHESWVRAFLIFEKLRKKFYEQ